MNAALKAVRGPAPDSGRILRLGLVVCLGLGVMVSAVGVVYAKYRSRTLFVELQDMKRTQDGMDVEWGQLQLEQSTWAAHGRIESIARKRLGMVLPQPQQVVVIE